MPVKVRLKMKSCYFICEILPKQDFYRFQFKIAELVSQLPMYNQYNSFTVPKSVQDIRFLWIFGDFSAIKRFNLLGKQKTEEEIKPLLSCFLFYSKPLIFPNK